MMTGLTRDACRWVPTTQQLYESGTRQTRSEVACCGCGIKIAYVDAWSAVPYGRNNVKLPLPSYLHCVACKNDSDATVAWMRAYRR